MYYNGLINFDTGNWEGLSVTLFVSGCTNKCEECHNPKTWDFMYGQYFTVKTLNLIIDMLKNKHIKNFVISGGDPMHKRNIETVAMIISEVRNSGFNGNIVIFSGYEREELLTNGWFKEYIQNQIDYLIDGRYEKDKATKELQFRGSTNQRIWKRDRKTGEIKVIS